MDFYQKERAAPNHNQKIVSIIDHPRLSFLKRILDPKVVESFTANTGDCWLHMEKLRSSAICSVCSARFPRFFNKDQTKAFVDQGTCNTLVDRCRVFFYETFSFIGGMLNRGAEVKELTNLNSSNHEWVLELENRARMGDIIGFLRYFDKSRKLSERNEQKDRINLCGRVLNVGKAPALQHLRLKMGIIDENLPTILEHLKTLVNTKTQQRKPLLKSQIHNSRSLDAILDVDPNDSFRPDTLVLLPRDNMFTSQGGLPEMAVMQSGKQPMNMSLVFP